LDQRVGRTYHGCRPFRSKLYRFVSGFGISCTSLTARKEGRGSARYRRTNFRECRTRPSTMERRRLGDSRLRAVSNVRVFAGGNGYRTYPRLVLMISSKSAPNICRTTGFMRPGSAEST
jgi:hypothetical protein